MAKLSLCILDDKIPVEQLTDINVKDTGYIDSNIIKHCLTLKNADGSPEDWGDSNLRNFVDLIKDDENYIISGFKNHSFFFNHREDMIFNPDIIVFDWDMGDGGQNSSKSLLQLLSSTYCLVAIFTGEDAEDGVSLELEKPDFIEYKNRCFLIKKQDQDSANTLKSKIIEREKDFSFEFGNEFKKASLNALDNILVDLGKVTSDEINHYFNIEDDNDLSVFLAEKYHTILNLNGIKIPKSKNKSSIESLRQIVRKKFEKQLATQRTKVKKPNSSHLIDNDILEKLWSYRLYNRYNQMDTNVRKGDIVTKDDRFYFVINSDCNLLKFWRKNFGYLNIIPLHLIDEKNEELKGILNLTKDGKKINYNPSSISNHMNEMPDGAFCLPFVRFNDEYKSFILFSSTITNIKIEAPKIEKKQLASEAITYSFLKEYTRICSLSEPFLTPLVMNLLNSLAGNGSPDYSNPTKKLLDSKIKNIFS